MRLCKSRCWMVLGLVTSLAIASVAYGQTDEENRTTPLAEQLEQLQESFDDEIESMGSRLDNLDDFAGDKTIVHSGASRSTMKVSGRVHADWWGFPDTSGDVPDLEGGGGGDPQDRIGFRRLRFGVKGNVRDNMLYKIEMEFAAGNKSEFRDAYLGWTDLPWLRTLLMGNQKRPYGLDHLNSSRYNVFMERPLVIEAFNQDARRLGLASYGFSDNKRWNWRYGVYNQQLVQGTGKYVNDNMQGQVAARLANTIWYDEVSGGRGYAHWGISGTWANTDGLASDQDDNEARFRTRPEARTDNRWFDTGHILGADDYGLVGLEGVVNVGPLQIVGEYQATWMSREAGFGNDLTFDGGYVYVAYFLTGDHMPWDRETGTLARIKPMQNFWRVRRCDGCVDHGMGAWQIAARYSYADYTDNDIFGGTGDAVTLGLNWYWNQNARMQFNLIHGEIHDRTDNLLGGDYTIAGARFMIDF